MIMKMPYRQYKKHYSDCKTVTGTYDDVYKTIEVVVPDERIKKSGVRGKCFSGYHLWFINAAGEKHYCVYRAVSKENAMKQHVKTCKQEGWMPCEPPEDCGRQIFRHVAG